MSNEPMGPDVPDALRAPLRPPERASEGEIIEEWEQRSAKLVRDLTALADLPYPRFGSALIASALSDAQMYAEKVYGYVQTAKRDHESDLQQGIREWRVSFMGGNRYIVKARTAQEARRGPWNPSFGGVVGVELVESEDA